MPGSYPQSVCDVVSGTHRPSNSDRKEILSVLALSYWLFDERIGMPQIIGCLFIVAGIACLAVSETQEAEVPGAGDDAPGHAGGNPGAGSASAGAAHLAASAEQGTRRG
jgi:hypothetical protein